MLGPAGRIAGIYDRVHAWASKPGSDGVTPIDHDDVKRALGEIHAMWRINELLNWQVAAAGEDINVADAASTKVFGTERIQYIGRLAEEIVGKYGNPADPETAELLHWLDSQTKRNLVITFGGGVNEVDARDDRRVRPQGAEGASMTTRRYQGEPSRRSRPPAVAKPRAGRDPVNQPMINNWVEAIGDTQPDLRRRGRGARCRASRNRGPTGDDPGLDDVRPGWGAPDRRSASGPMMEAVRRRRLHRRGRHQLRADLSPLPAARASRSASPPRCATWSARSRPRSVRAGSSTSTSPGASATRTSPR